MANTPNIQENVKSEKIKVPAPSPVEHENSTEPKDEKALLTYLDEDFDAEINESFDIRCLQDMLEESQSDAHTDCEDSEVKKHEHIRPRGSHETRSIYRLPRSH